jgi:hypothetical protein
MPLDGQRVVQCLDEVEQELFRLADLPECQRFHQETQFTALILLLFRAESLLRSLLLPLEAKNCDCFDATLRAFEESWNLAHEFRLIAQHDRAIRWLARDNDTWSARIPLLAAFARGRGHANPNLGHDYGSLSELAHPTRTAAENSTTLCGIRRGIDGAEAAIGAALENDERRIEAALYRLLWLIVDQDPQFLPIPAAHDNMAASLQFVDAYEHIDPAT